jgi:hypothetical protein
MPYRIPRRRPSAQKYYALVIPDVHVGYILDTPTYSVGAWDVTMQALDALRDRLTHVVILGDFGNWESLSHWASIRAEQAFIEEDVALVNARLDEISTISAKRTKGPLRVVFCEGNHEAWAGLFEAKYPVMRDAVNLKRRLRFAQRGWTWIPENSFYALGNIYFTHGHIRGVRSPIDMIRRKGVSVRYGHVHSREIANIRTLNGEHSAASCGCLASIEPPPPYAKGETPDSWVHGFELEQIRANGSFQSSYRQIYDECWTELEDGTELIADPARVRGRLREDAKIRADLRKAYAERYYVPGGAVVRTEPHHGKARTNKAGELIVSPAARTRRARIVRTVEGS